MINNNAINRKIILYLFLYLVMCYVFSPGFMTKDSVVQLYQAEQGIIDDWHPPVMSLLWSFLLGPFGTGGMLYFQLFILFFSCYLMHQIFENSKLSYLFLCIPFLPWVFNFEFVIWKDVGLAYTWLLSITLALYYKHKKRSKLIIFSVFAFFLYGLLVRSNSPAGAIFLLPFLVSCVSGFTVKKSITISSLFIVLYFAFIPNIFNEFVGAKKGYGFTYTMIDDIVAIKLEGGQGSNSSLFSSQDMKKYKDCSRLNLYRVGAGICDLNKMKYIIENNYSELKKEWVNTIRSNLGIYVKYRVTLFFDSLKSPNSDPYYYYENNLLHPPYYIVGDEHFNHVKVASRIKGENEQVLLYKYISVVERTFSFIFKPYFWLIVSLCQLMFFIINRAVYSIPFWMLPLSSVAYVSGYIPFTQAHDLRYFYYSIVVATVCCILILMLRIKSGVSLYFSIEK